MLVSGFVKLTFFSSSPSVSGISSLIYLLTRASRPVYHIKLHQTTSCMYALNEAMQLLMLASFERLMRALASSSATPFTNLQGAPFEPLSLRSWRTGTETSSFIWLNDNYWQWRLSYLTQGRHQKTFCSLVARCWLSSPEQLQREVNKIDMKGGYRQTVWWRGVSIECDKLKGGKRHQVTLIFSWGTGGVGCRVSARDRCQFHHTWYVCENHPRGRHALVDRNTQEISNSSSPLLSQWLLFTITQCKLEFADSPSITFPLQSVEQPVTW